MWQFLGSRAEILGSIFWVAGSSFLVDSGTLNFDVCILGKDKFVRLDKRVV